jgi:hypothetical protein
MSSSAKPLHIDIPVQLAEVKVAFSIAALAFEGDLPASIFHLQLITTDVANWNAKAQVIAVFHTNAGHVTLHDDAYNAERRFINNPLNQHRPGTKNPTDRPGRLVQQSLTILRRDTVGDRVIVVAGVISHTDPTAA